jgi:hypothetical protein
VCFGGSERIVVNSCAISEKYTGLNSQKEDDKGAGDSGRNDNGRPSPGNRNLTHLAEITSS